MSYVYVIKNEILNIQHSIQVTAMSHSSTLLKEYKVYSAVRFFKNGALIFYKILKPVSSKMDLLSFFTNPTQIIHFADGRTGRFFTG